MATEKVRVVKYFGQSNAQGLMDPKLNMVTHKGTITWIDPSGERVHVSGQGVGLVKVFYPWELFVNFAEATGHWSYASGDGSIVLGHGEVYASGVPNRPATGMVYMHADGRPRYFSRP